MFRPNIGQMGIRGIIYDKQFPQQPPQQMGMGNSNILALIKNQVPFGNYIPDGLAGAGIGYGIGQLANKNGRLGAMIGGGIGTLSDIQKTRNMVMY